MVLFYGKCILLWIAKVFKNHLNFDDQKFNPFSTDESKEETDGEEKKTNESTAWLQV